MFNLLIDGDFDGGFAARLTAGVDSDSVDAMLFAATDIVHHCFHHGASEDGLCLQRTNCYQQEQ